MGRCVVMQVSKTIMVSTTISKIAAGVSRAREFGGNASTMRCVGGYGSIRGNAMKPFAYVTYLALLFFGLSAAAAESTPPIVLHWFPRPPFHYEEQQKLTGLLVEPVLGAFQFAGVAYATENTPATRIFNLIKENHGYDCALGWYKNTEREQFAQFSDPIYHDKALIGVARKDSQIPLTITAKELISTYHVRMVAKQTFSHGAYLDNLLASPSKAIAILRTSGEIPVILKMVQSNRADLALVDAEEVGYMFSHGLDVANFEILHFPDVPPSEFRYLMCSKRVPESVLTRINAAIKATIHLAK